MSRYQDARIPDFNWNTNLKKPKASTPADFLINQQQINDKINKITRAVSSYDLLNVVKQINNEEEYFLEINQLTTSSALSIGKTFTVGQTRYEEGNFLLKTENGEIQLIEANNSSLFYPAKYDSNDHIVTYKFSTDKPIKGSATLNEEELSSPYEKIIIKDTQTTTVYYNINQELINNPNTLIINPIDFEKKESIIPVIKFFIQKKELKHIEWEECYISYNLKTKETDSTLWQLSFNQTIPSGYSMKVVIK